MASHRGRMKLSAMKEKGNVLLRFENDAKALRPVLDTGKNLRLASHGDGVP